MHWTKDLAKRKAKSAGSGSAATAAGEISSEGMGLDTLEGLIGFNLRLAYNIQVQRFAAVGGAFNIRPAQFAILVMTYYQPDLKQMELTKALRKQHANVVTLLSELENRGLIDRVSSGDDKRSRVLHLTPAGKKLTEKMLERRDRLEENFRETFGERDRAQLLKLLKKFRRLNPDPDIDIDL